jgi:hypothetical protein
VYKRPRSFADNAKGRQFVLLGWFVIDLSSITRSRNDGFGSDQVEQ